MKKISFLGLKIDFDCSELYVPNTHSRVLINEKEYIIFVSSHTPALIRILHIALELVSVFLDCRRHITGRLAATAHRGIQTLASLLCVLLVLAISTIGIQRLFAMPNGQILYNNDVLVTVSSLGFASLEYLLLSHTMRHCIPSDLWRRRMLYAMTALATVSVIGLPAGILLTTGDIACWDAALAVSVSTVMLLYCDSRVNPPKAKKAVTPA